MSVTLQQLTKPQLIELCRSHGIHTGDTARTSKDEYITMLTAAGITEAPHGAGPAPAAAAQSAPDVNTVAALLAQLLGSGAVNEDRVRQIVDESLAQRQPRVETVVVQDGRADVKVEGLAHKQFGRVRRLAECRQNILLVGPAGCGKSHLARQVADSMGLDFATLSCSAGMSENQLTGWLLPIEAGGRFVYVSSDFVRLYAEGGLFLIDEVDAADSNVLLVVNAALANGELYIPHRIGATHVKRHPDFVCIAAANTYGTGPDRVYAARSQLDESTLDRFRAGMTEVDYDPRLEEQLCAADVLAWCLPVREKIRSLKLRRVMSTRVMRDFTVQLRAGFSRDEMEAAYFAGWTRDELVKVGREG